jgi:hypothetical protein
MRRAALPAIAKAQAVNIAARIGTKLKCPRACARDAASIPYSWECEFKLSAI